MRKFLILSAILVVAMPLCAMAQEQAAAPPAKPASGGFFKATTQETENLKILKIGATDRIVTLKSELGDTLEIECGPEVKNFAQLKVGDDVVAKFTETLSVSVEAAGEPMDTKETTTSEAKLGDKPASTVMERTQVRAKILSIDKGKGTATLQCYDGEPFTVTPLVRANLDKVQVGNIVVFTHTTGHAISVSKPAAKAKGKPKTENKSK